MEHLLKPVKFIQVPTLPTLNVLKVNNVKIVFLLNMELKLGNIIKI